MVKFIQNFNRFWIKFYSLFEIKFTLTDKNDKLYKSRNFN